MAVRARSTKEFTGIMKRCPITNVDGPKRYFALLTANPDKEFLSTDFSPDQVQFVSETIDTIYATKQSASKFNNNHFERKLKAVATTQNLNAMIKPTALAAAQRDAATDGQSARD